MAPCLPTCKDAHRQEGWVEGLPLGRVPVQGVRQLAEGGEVAPIPRFQAGVRHVRTLAPVPHHNPAARRRTLTAKESGGSITARNPKADWPL